MYGRIPVFRFRVALTFAALIFLAVMVTGCATVPERYWQVSRTVSDRFTYVSDRVKHGVDHFEESGVTGDTKFTGDCEEAAIAMKYQLAKIGVHSTIWVTTHRVGLHAMTCSDDGWCFDAYNVPVRRESVPFTFLYKM